MNSIINFTPRLVLILVLTLIISSCSKVNTELGYKTKNVIIIVMDGPRYSETWGDSTHQYIPRLANQLSSSGVIYANFYSEGPTYTNPGHTAITTGNYQVINNAGLELPQNPSIFQYWLKTSKKDHNDAFVIASKDKLEVLANCLDSIWSNRYNPSTNCGIDGLGSGYRSDSITFERSKEIFIKHHPSVVLINFREPDTSGHTGNWENYTNGIREVDEYIYQLIEFIEDDVFYKDVTTYFVTNDHGRHLDDISNGFSGHGDDCEGCRHINLFAFGPDFKKGQIIETKRELIDISATIAELLDFQMPTGKGHIMFELFE